MAIRTALRQSLRDFYFNSWRLAPANLVWGIILILGLLAGPFSLLGAALLLVLAVPTAGLYRMGAMIARDEPTTFGDFLGAMRRFGPASLIVATGGASLIVVFTTNVVVGLQANNPLGWFVTAMALWGDVGIAMFLVALWPILLDPQRDGIGLRQKLMLTGLVVIGRPLRVIALALVVVIILAISTLLFAALVVISIAYLALVSGRIMLPLADGVEARLPEARRVR